MTKNYAYFMWLCKEWKSVTCWPQKERQEEHLKAVVQGVFEKLGMADYIWKEKEIHLV